MYRKTVLEKNGAQRITVITDDNGTQVFDENGTAIATYGGDRHDEAVKNYTDGGWTIVSDEKR